MSDIEVKQAKLDYLKASTEVARATADLARHDLEHKEASDRERVYHFAAPIYAETIDTCIEVLQHWINLDPLKKITVAFNSPGGVVFEGFALYDFIADNVERGIAIDTTAYGKCASMATVTLQAGRVRSLHRNAFFMVHEVDTFISGTMQQLKDQLEFTNRLQDRIEDVLVSRTNPGMITKEELHGRTMHKDWWLTADEALEFGFIDEIVKF